MVRIIMATNNKGKIEELKQKMKENTSLEELFMEIINDG